MTGEQLDKLFDRLPFLDGSGRRRFVAGGIILIGIAAFNWRSLSGNLGSLEVKDFFASPMVGGGSLLLVYAIGSIVDLFGELFLVRAASGLFWGLTAPARVTRTPGKKLMSALKVSAACCAAIPQSIVGMLLGFVGRTRYRIDLSGFLSRDAQSVYDRLPEKIATGLREPVGDNSEIALRFITDKFDSESDKKWARRLVGRAKDVAATTTALLVILVYALLSGKVIGYQAPGAAAAEVSNIINNLGGVYSGRSLSYLRQQVAQGLYVEPQSIEALRLDPRSVPAFVTDPETLNSLQRLSSELRTLRAFYEPDGRPSRNPPDSRALVQMIESIELRNPRAYLEADLTYAKRKLEAREPLAEGYLEFLDHKIGNPAAAPLVDELVKRLPAYNEEALRNARSKFREKVLLMLATLPFFLLYLGFFMSLRNAITATLEALAYHSGEWDRHVGEDKLAQVKSLEADEPTLKIRAQLEPGKGQVTTNEALERTGG